MQIEALHWHHEMESQVPGIEVTGTGHIFYRPAWVCDTCERHDYFTSDKSQLKDRVRNSVMCDLDHSLLYEARKILNGANIHLLGTAIFCYETSPQNSTQRVVYETGLRRLVSEHRKNQSLLLRAQIACKASEGICAASDLFKKEVASIRKPSRRRMRNSKYPLPG